LRRTTRILAVEKDGPMSWRSHTAGLVSVAAVTVCVALPAVFRAGSLIASAQVRSESVALDNVILTRPDGSVVIKHVEFSGTNLSHDEIEALFSADLSAEQGRELLAKLKARNISIPEIRVNSKDSSAWIEDFQAVNVDSGKVGALSIASIDALAHGKEGADITLKTNPLRIEDADFSLLFTALRSSAPQLFRFSKLSWAGMDASIVDPDTPADAAGGNLIHVRIASLEATNTYQNELLSKFGANLNGLTVEAPKASKMGRALALLGYDKLEFGMTSSGAYDAMAQTMTISDLVDGVNIGALAMKLQLGGLDSRAFQGDFNQRLSNWMNGAIADLEVRFTNAGLFDKAIAFVATQQRLKPEDVKRNWTAATSQLVGAVFGGSPDAAALSNAFSQFISSPKNLTVTARGKTGAIGIRELQDLKAVPSLLARVDFGATANQ
jgi:hypothetical protein